METTFNLIQVGTAFTVDDAWGRDEIDISRVYFKIDDRQARLAAGGPGNYRASTMPRITFAASHPVQSVK